MTYLVGLRYKGTAAIICDSVSSKPGSRCEMVSDTFLKSGSLGPGIMYAYTGDIHSAQKFVIRAKDFLTGRHQLAEFWVLFRRFADHYVKASEGERFALLISERVTGVPRFHIFDSKAGLSEHLEVPVSLGSGRNLLDPIVHDLWSRGVHELLIPKEKNRTTLFPYAYCLFLMERAQGYEASELQRAGVGGYFHFCYQTGEMESRQAPAVYVIVTIDETNKTLKGWAYRVSFCGPALVVESPLKNERVIVLESSSWPRVDDLSARELQEIKDRVDAEVAAQPFYNVSAFGIADPAFRGGYALGAVSDAKDCVIDRSGTVTAEFECTLRQVVSTSLQAHGYRVT